ncbi:MAG: hypothetical protein ACOCPZ_04125 [Natrialbaceae archaeon]
MGSLLEAIRRPEYTGENRCWPCTVTNVTLLTVVSGVLWLRGRRRSAMALTAGGLAAIGLRGYLVPYTPSFAPRLARKLPVDPFGHDDRVEPGSIASLAEGTPASEPESAEGSPPGGEAILAALADAGVLEFLDGEVSLEADFREEWRREMEALRERDLEGLAAVADGLTPTWIAVTVAREAVEPGLVLDPDEGQLTYVRRTHAIAELAATRALAGRVDDRVARAAGRPLRSLLERCPLCDQELIITDARCCGESVPAGGSPAEKLLCPACNERVFTFV